MSESKKQLGTADVLYGRFHDLLLGHNFAQLQLGYIHTLDLDYGEKLPSRTLLEVEEKAQKNRNKEDTQKLKYMAQVNSQLHHEIEEQINTYLEDIDYIYTDIINIQDNIPAILDILAVTSASVGRIDPLVNDLLWLSDDIVKLINLPQYRKDKDPKKAIKVESPSLALRYLGLENLKSVVPTFSLKQWAPYSTMPFRLLKRKLWESGMTTAIAAKTLAQMNDVNPFHAFVLGMFHDVGKIAIVRLYLRTFETLWQNKTKDSRDNKEKELHSALVELSPDPLCLRNLMVEHSAALSCQIIKKMSFKYLPIQHSMEQIANKITFSKMDDLAKVVAKAQCYSQYKKLKEHNLVESDEVKIWFKIYNFQVAELKILASTSLHNLQLKIEH
ncbi:HDOD domain-containing protein [Pseudoalteromonas denitrificans]|uniref:HDOD domain-containing protein n=1 Tax=Pseudoalteromonas denitrificans DSM 6059 TaxID=1123010 RepID=A0A1I1JWU1_9GAMM|nr:HDOD domain-containing protein [Pseudoalteromonas denitrificans]SFC52976.1 HDOD domain-containing protein [Pseudoalteromonas denitrificans DSM 6059]